MIASFRELFAHLSLRRRRQFVPVLMLMFAGALAELMSLGAIVPFLSLVVSPEDASTIGVLQPILGAFGIETPSEIVIAAVSIFALSAVIAGAVRLALTWRSQRFIFGVAEELSVAVYDRTLHQPYAFHTSRNSSETLAAINKVQMLTTGLLVPLMQAIIGVVIATFILLGLVYVDPLVALTSGFGFGFIYLLVIASMRARMRRNGGTIARAQKQRLQAAGEGLGGIRDILLDRSQPVFVRRFAVIEGELRKAQATNNFIAAAPRFVIEGLGLVLIAGLAVVLSQRPGGLSPAIPVLGALALGAQRLVPLLQQIYAGWAASMTNGQLLRDVLDILKLPDAPQFSVACITPLRLQREIRIENLEFSYPAAGRPTLRDICLNLPKGARIGFVGKTGSGKSTLMDIVLGLLEPQSGHVLIDGTPLSDANRSAWQAGIAHVPQSIYLTDASIAENIAFGIPIGEIDGERLQEAAKRANLSDVIEMLPQRFDTLVGERGVRLSGGQRQRIGIARALYRRASLLVFDEATSALDASTEAEVMEALHGLDPDLTILIIAHRLSTVEMCNKVVRLEDGRIVSEGPPSDVLRRGASTTHPGHLESTHAFK